MNPRLFRDPCVVAAGATTAVADARTTTALADRKSPTRAFLLRGAFHRVLQARNVQVSAHVH